MIQNAQIHLVQQRPLVVDENQQKYSAINPELVKEIAKDHQYKIALIHKHCYQVIELSKANIIFATNIGEAFAAKVNGQHKLAIIEQLAAETSHEALELNTAKIIAVQMDKELVEKLKKILDKGNKVYFDPQRKQVCFIKDEILTNFQGQDKDVIVEQCVGSLLPETISRYFTIGQGINADDFKNKADSNEPLELSEVITDAQNGDVLSIKKLFEYIFSKYKSFKSDKDVRAKLEKLKFDDINIEEHQELILNVVHYVIGFYAKQPDVIIAQRKILLNILSWIAAMMYVILY